MAIKSLSQFLRYLISKSKGKAASYLILQVLLNALQGVGLLSILPFLYLAGLGLDQSNADGMAAILLSKLEALGFTITLPYILTAYAVAIILLSALKRYQSVLSERIQNEFVGELSVDLVRAINAAPWTTLAKTKHSQILQALSEDLKQVQLATALSLQLAGILSLMFVSLGVACLIAFELVIPSLAAMAILWYCLVPFHKRSIRFGQELRVTRERFFDLLSLNLNALKLIRIHSAEEQQNQEFRTICDGTIAQADRFRRSHASALWLFESAAVLTLAVFIYAAVAWVKLPVPSLILLIVIYARYLPLLSRAQQYWQAILHALPSFTAYQSTYKTFSTRTETRTHKIQDFAKANFTLTSCIQIDQLSFSYDSAKLFSNVSLKIPAKQTTALVGISGAGKSTLADLIAGLQQPETGRILIDGTRLTATNAPEWRRHIAYVPQENFLFHDSIRKNLTWANPHATDTQIESCLERANARNIVAALPDGLDTIVGERGSRLSGGERQRIALARALITDPKLLILDEATNALDKENETQIRKTIQTLSGQLAVIIITHDPTIASIAQHVYCLDDKKIVLLSNQNGTPKP